MLSFGARALAENGCINLSTNYRNWQEEIVPEKGLCKNTQSYALVSGKPRTPIPGE